MTMWTHRIAIAVNGFPSAMPNRAAGYPHRDADVGLLQGRGIVDPVTGHRHNIASRFQDAHEADLVVRRDSCEHRHVTDSCSEIGVLEPVEVGASHDLSGESEFARNRRGGRSMITGDHLLVDAS